MSENLKSYFYSANQPIFILLFYFIYIIFFIVTQQFDWRIVKTNKHEF